MLFTQLIFFIFLGALLGLYWAIPGNRGRKNLLLAGSYLFYGAWDWRFLGLILLSTLVDFIVGRQLGTQSDPARRRVLLVCSLIVNLGALGFFKYFNFFAESLQQLLGLAGFEADWNTLNIILPVGISFYTFQTLSYTIDVYRKQLEPEKDFFDFALFVAFFPQLVAGPIVRARDFLYQLDTIKHFREIDYRWAATLFMVGFFKKAVVADNLAIYVDAFYANPAAHSVYDAWFAVLAYAAQIYCDFSGYTDMAIAVAGLLGYKLHVNFATPYVATDITDFWRRWHISLSTWLRDYLYIPLGGSRDGKLNTYKNLMITMLLGGLWHGASWNFVLWGGFHGLGLAVHKFWMDQAHTPRLPRAIATLITLLFVVLLWVPFRAPDFATTWETYLQLFGFGPAADTQLSYVAGVGMAGLLLLHYCRNGGAFHSFWRTMPLWLYSLGLGAVFALALSLRAMEYQPFIYFQF